MKKTYNIVLQSIIGTGSTANKSYFYDWSRIPDVPYYVTFTYNSSITTLASSNVALIFLLLNQNYNMIASDQLGVITGYRSDFLGSIYHTPSGSSATNAYLSANTTSNPPMFLEGRPKNNNFSVQITAGVDLAYPNALANYTLTLSFEECNDNIISSII